MAKIRSTQYCKKCLNRGYHSVLHQSSCARYCPIHGTSLEVRCRTCDATAPYRLHVGLLDVPYRCGSCGYLYGTTPPPPLPYKRPLAMPLLEVRPGYLHAALQTMEQEWGSTARFLTEALAADVQRLQAHYLEEAS